MAAPTLRGLLEPAIVALSNLAAETASVKDDMRHAGAIDTCVHLLNAKVSHGSARCSAAFDMR